VVHFVLPLIVGEQQELSLASNSSQKRSCANAGEKTFDWRPVGSAYRFYVPEKGIYYRCCCGWGPFLE
jgi:hypothetical protein